VPKSEGGEGHKQVGDVNVLILCHGLPDQALRDVSHGGTFGAVAAAVWILESFYDSIKRVWKTASDRTNSSNCPTIMPPGSRLLIVLCLVGFGTRMSLKQ
jgi:hypothetical protein